MQKQSLSKNLIFQFLYQGLILVIPLIISPYLTRVLHETALGVYSYTNSIAYYFVLLAMLGISRHGQRIISKYSSDEIQLRKAFWSLFAAHLLTASISICCYFCVILFFVKSNTNIFLIQTLYVLSAFFDVTWLFYGLENFRSVVIKNAGVKVLECILIFSLVKSPDDLWKYTLIASGGLLLGQMIMLPQAIMIVKPIRFSKEDFLQHIKPLLIFSISVIAVSLYTVFDKTLIGILSNKENVAFYEYSNKIINIPKTVIGVVGIVMFPRACKLANEGKISEQKKYIDYSFLLTAFIGMGSIFGLCAISKEFALIYYGEEFSICGDIIMSLSPLIFIIGIGDILRTQYMIPNHMDKQFNFCIILNAIINVILSTSLIPIIGIYGAIVGTISAEVFGVIYQFLICKKFIKISECIKITLPFVGLGFFMFLLIKILGTYITDGVIGLFIKIVTGGMCYIIVSSIYLFVYKREMWILIIKKIPGLKKFV